MDDFGINEMLDMQRALQEKYKDKWNPICPDRGKDQLLWMIGEIGEVIDIIKNLSYSRRAMSAPVLRLNEQIVYNPMISAKN